MLFCLCILTEYMLLVYPMPGTTDMDIPFKLYQQSTLHDYAWPDAKQVVVPVRVLIDVARRSLRWFAHNKCAASSPSCSVSFLISDFCSVICQSCSLTFSADSFLPISLPSSRLCFLTASRCSFHDRSLIFLRQSRRRHRLRRRIHAVGVLPLFAVYWSWALRNFGHEEQEHSNGSIISVPVSLVIWLDQKSDPTSSINLFPYFRKPEWPSDKFSKHCQLYNTANYYIQASKQHCQHTVTHTVSRYKWKFRIRIIKRLWKRGIISKLIWLLLFLIQSCGFRKARGSVANWSYRTDKTIYTTDKTILY